MKHSHFFKIITISSILTLALCLTSCKEKKENGKTQKISEKITEKLEELKTDKENKKTADSESGKKSDENKKTDTAKSDTTTKSNQKSIAVFVPGIIADSPIYAMLADGVKSAVNKYNEGKDKADRAEVYILEAGTNQAEWSKKITALAAQQKYDVIISSNPSLPDLVVPIVKQFPNQKFILLDAELKGNKNIFTICYNQYEQAFLTGYIGGLMSKSHKMALIAAQEYPVMNNILLPYFEKGGKEANKKTTVDFRVVGNWYDANKGAVLADSVIENGVDVILPICGGASQGVINSAVNHKVYVTWFDNNGFEKAPGTIISSSILKQKEMASIATENYLSGLTAWGNADMVGVSDGFVDFVQDDPLYIQTVPANIRNKMKKMVDSIRSGNYKVK